MTEITTKGKLILGLQHVLAMFGATVLVPFLTGMNPSIALLTAGVGTLLFHTCTKGIVPVFLGSSFAFIGAISLVLFLTGMNPSIALLTAGVGTLLFHTCTKGIVPVFLGSSFAFIGAISLVLRESGVGAVKGGVIAAGVVYIVMSRLVKIYGVEKIKSFFPPVVVGPTIVVIGLGAVKGGVIAAGVVYIVMSRLVKIYGVEKIKSFFPPVVVGPTIVVIGLRLSPTALSMAGYSNGHFDGKSLIVSGIVVLSMIGISILGKSFFKLVPILISVILGYIVSIFLGMVDFTPIKEAGWIGLSSDAFYSLVTVPEFSLTSILAIAPIALVVFIEHIGDITTNGAVVGKDFFANPGISRTLLGDGLATVVAGFLGGPANTTYGENTGVLAVTKVYDPSILRIVAGFLGGPANTTYGENTGVLAVTKVYDPSILRIAACYAIGLAFIGKFGVILQTIPAPVMGGISVILFGMIASVGMRTLIEAQLDFSHSRNLIISSSLILVFGIGIDNIVVWRTVSLSGLAIAALIGVILNKIFPENI